MKTLFQIALVVVLTLFALPLQTGGTAFGAEPHGAKTAAVTSDPDAKVNSTVPWTAGARFRECKGCPEMVVVPKAHFQVGFNVRNSEDDRLKIDVSIKRNFAVGIFHVTVAQYAQFVSETHRRTDGSCEILDPPGNWIDDPKANWRNPSFPQTGQHPVVCVSWEDTQDYIAWLNAKVRGVKLDDRRAHAGPYRLMSVEEFSYVARAGGVAPASEEKHWREYANFGLAQCWPCGSGIRGKDHWYYTSPEGAFHANDLGVYDAVGNVWTLLQDCKIDHASGAPTDGSAWTTQGHCDLREGGAGSWDDTLSDQSDDKPANRVEFLSKIPFRGYFKTYARNYANGFRVARDLD